MLHRLVQDEGEEKKRMRQDDGEEVKCAGGYAESVKGDNKKPIAMELHDAMRKCWQIKTNWPDPEAVLQTIGPDTREQAIALQTTLGTVLARLQEFPEKPAIFLAYMDWAKSLHISLTDHKDVRHSRACIFVAEASRFAEATPLRRSCTRAMASSLAGGCAP